MASGACHVLSSARYSKNINISVDTQYFDQEKAFGNGSSVLCKATVTALRFTSSSGSSDQATKAATECFLAGSAVGNNSSKNRSTDHASDFGKKAAQMLLTDLEKQVCFDQHLQ